MLPKRVAGTHRVMEATKRLYVQGVLRRTRAALTETPSALVLYCEYDMDATRVAVGDVEKAECEVWMGVFRNREEARYNSSNIHNIYPTRA